MPKAPTPLAIEYVPLHALKPDPNSAREHTKAHIKQIARSYTAFGINNPVLTDEAGNIISGHGRYEAYEFLGLTEVPVIRLGHLTPEQAQAYAIADNRLAETSTWDDQRLAEKLRVLTALSLDFDIEATGFNMGEIDFRIEGLTEAAPGPDPADDLSADIGVAITKPGDLWLPGPHKVICATALEPQSYELLMGQERAAIILADAPYNLRIRDNVSGRGKVKHREFLMASGAMTVAQFTVFLNTAFRLAADYSQDGALHYIFMDWRHGGQLQAAVEPIYGELKNLCVWVKDNGGMGSLYRSRHELVFVFKHGNAPHRNNVELGRHGRNRTNVWEYPGANTFSRSSEEGPLATLHPTVKPVALLADALLDASGRGDIVLDPFLGSGSTLVAAQRVGRVCRGIEIDPLYVDVAIRRWQRITGEDAVHAASGKTFDAIASEVGHGE